MTVREFAKTHLKDGMIVWVCPHISRNQRITPKEYECGLEYATASSIPQFIAEKEVRKHWVERTVECKDGCLCIIWENE